MYGTAVTFHIAEEPFVRLACGPHETPGLFTGRATKSDISGSVLQAHYDYGLRLPPLVYIVLVYAPNLSPFSSFPCPKRSHFPFAICRHRDRSILLRQGLFLT